MAVVVRDFVRASYGALADPAGSLKPLEAVAAGAALSEVTLQAKEFADTGSHVSGSAIVRALSVSSLDVKASPPRAVVAVCLDESPVLVHSLENPDGASANTRTAHVYTAVHRDGAWRVVERVFRSDPDCA